MQFPTQKRKGGRKPVYATQEERKMRNRAAQAGESQISLPALRLRKAGSQSN